MRLASAQQHLYVLLGGHGPGSAYTLVRDEGAFEAFWDVAKPRQARVVGRSSPLAAARAHPVSTPILSAGAHVCVRAHARAHAVFGDHPHHRGTLSVRQRSALLASESMYGVRPMFTSNSRLQGGGLRATVLPGAC